MPQSTSLLSPLAGGFHALPGGHAGFEEELKAYCHSETGPYLRPFTGNRNWKTASVFIIGTNPATPLRDEFEDFESYWEGLTGNTEQFRKTYAAKHSGQESKTSGNVRLLKSLIGEEHCLVTNRCWHPTASVRELSSRQKTQHETFLRRLIEFCRPKVLFVHGQDGGIAFVERTYEISLDRFEPPAVQNTVVDGTLLLAYPHLSGKYVPRANFQPDTHFPIFADRIRAHLLKA
ncbi:hypothetical protein F6X40_17575 [Paraburkholderia sp. UCT31]|uniref:hypothetical protein n=1 Tax=Paraburkholderia sp. UCT31 TaxID=2615209 RepID=UPI001655014A|nr:hypothetical protein [Paraburkholderia sp. UCT31]MBC8738571.1 hypothetical protein [Paraburkholderia sp. UCT31]